MDSVHEKHITDINMNTPESMAIDFGSFTG